MLRAEIKTILSEIIAKRYGGETPPDFTVEASENPEHGDYATNAALVLAHHLQKNPTDVAQDLVNAIGALEHGHFKKFFSKITAVPPGFINFHVTNNHLEHLIKEIVKKQEKFGKGVRKKQTVIIEYSSPNIAKPMGVHHLRTTIIGQALVNVYNFLGYKVLAMTFPGDWGTQFGALIAAYKKWGDRERMQENPTAEMLSLYVKFNQAAKEDEALQEEARLEFRKLEQGDKENRRLWNWFRRESFQDFDKVYKLLGVKIPLVFAESFFESMMKGVIEDALNRGVAVMGEDGSIVIPLRDEDTPLLLQKSDGATLYATRDLAQMKCRMDRWHPQKIIIVVANQQTFYFKQLFEAGEMLGYATRDQLVHVKFGMVLAPGGKKFATRDGNLVPMEEVLHEAVSRAKAVVEKLNPELPDEEKEKIAQVVGIGAVKFFDLSQNRMSDIVFDWDKMLNLKGASAPYIQYSYARIKSILRKAGKVGERPKTIHLKDKEGIVIARHLLHFSEVVADTAERYEPNHLAEYLLKLAEKINSFYESVQVLNSEEDLKNSRLILLESAATVLKTGCVLLGIEVPEEM